MEAPMTLIKLHHLRADRLGAAVSELVRGFGSSEREVALVTDNLLQANLTGHDSHGVGMLPRYAAAYLEGGLKPNAHVQVNLDTGTLLALDGQAGFGQVICHETMWLGIAPAKAHCRCGMAAAPTHPPSRNCDWAVFA